MTRPWLWFAGLGGLAALVFLVVDEPAVKAAVQVPVYASAAVALVLRWRRTPSRLLGFSALAFSVYFVASIGGVIWPLVSPASLAASVPSVLDGAFLLAYLLLAVMLWRLGSRSNAPSRMLRLDTAIAAIGVTPLFWMLVIAPLLDSQLSHAALATYLSYPVLVLALVVLTLRLVFCTPTSGTAHLLLGGWAGCELAADVVYLRVGVTGDYAYGQWWQVLWIVSATCIGVLALHPSAVVLARPAPCAQRRGRLRLYVLACLLALPILAIAYSEVFLHREFVLVLPVVAALLLLLLITVRLADLMADNAEQVRDKARLVELSQDLEHQALHDPLTGLGNRVLFARAADAALATPISGTALLLLDLDDFKTINDTFGHEAGDQVLVEVGARLERLARPGVQAFRLGGDEFVLLMTGAVLEDARELAGTVTAVLTEPFDLGPRQIRPLATIGISIGSGDKERSVLLAEADMAMYDAKGRPSSGPSLFDPVLHRESLDRHQLERDLREAVTEDQLRLVYQPIVELASTDIVGVEALVRWHHPTRGLVQPARFIPLAEANGSILSMGDWVLLEAIRQLLAWDATGTGRRLTMSVNVSPSQLADPLHATRVRAALESTGVDPTRINLEITEAAFALGPDVMVERLHELKALGVSLAIDDFGTDYSSLSHLRRLPVDVLKVDKSFVDGIATEPVEWALTAAIIRLAVSLGKTTVAEGIETGGQLAHLRSLHVDRGQGYLFAKPLPADDIEALLLHEPGAVFLTTPPPDTLVPLPR